MPYRGVQPIRQGDPYYTPGRQREMGAVVERQFVAGREPNLDGAAIRRKIAYRREIVGEPLPAVVAEGLAVQEDVYTVDDRGAGGAGNPDQEVDAVPASRCRRVDAEPRDAVIRSTLGIVDCAADARAGGQTLEHGEIRRGTAVDDELQGLRGHPGQGEQPQLLVQGRRCRFRREARQPAIEEQAILACLQQLDVACAAPDHFPASLG